MSEIRLGILSVAESGTPSANRHVRALPAESRPHRWTDEGDARRCSECQMLSTWPGAMYACTTAQFRGAVHVVAERNRKARRRAERLR